jgi:hypothetical protein
MEDLEEELHFLELLELVHLDREITVVLVHLLPIMVMAAAEGQVHPDQMEQLEVVVAEDLEQHLLFLVQALQEVVEEEVGFMLLEPQEPVELAAVEEVGVPVVPDQPEPQILEEEEVEEDQTILIFQTEEQVVLE